VDAGDNFESTVKAISETINQNMEDGVIEYVIATHPDGDHIGGMKALFDQYTIESLIKFEGNYTSQKYKNFETAYINEGCDVYQIKSDIIDKNKGDKFISLSSDVFISFIDTTYYSSSESNGKSIVFVLEAYGTRVLMTGDADNASGHTDLEQKYMKAVGDIDILKVVHHGTSNGTTSEFLNIVDPEVAIICNGNYLGNKHGHPHPTAIKNLYSYDESIKVYCITGGGTIDGVANKTNNTYKCSSEDRFNQRNGLITLIIDNTGYKFNSEYYGSNLMELKNTQYYSYP
jgi:beta-lactamase superfamily II metal-dependent hydrolase